MSIIEESKELIKLLGGEKNISSLVHCVTRLRFQLVDEGKADTEAIERLSFVLSVVNKGGQYQVVIGPLVTKYFVAVNDQIDIKRTKEAKKKIKKGGTADFVISCISGAITPLLPVICGSALIRAILSALVNFGILPETASTCLVLTAAANAVFYFLPILIGFTPVSAIACKSICRRRLRSCTAGSELPGIDRCPGFYFFGNSVKSC